jgi:hypothetical protein
MYIRPKNLQRNYVQLETDNKLLYLNGHDSSTCLLNNAIKIVVYKNECFLANEALYLLEYKSN